MNQKNCTFGANLIAIFSMSLIVLFSKSTVETLVLFNKFGFYQFAYNKILTDLVITLIIMVFVLFYYRTIISADGIKGFTMFGKAHRIKWDNITNIYKKKILFIDTLFIEENGKKIHIGLFNNFDRFKTCTEQFNQEGLLASYLNHLTTEELRTLKNNNNMMALLAGIILILLMSISAYEHYIWSPNQWIKKVQSNVDQKSQNIPRPIGEFMVLKNITFLPNKKQTEYLYTVDLLCDEEFFSQNVKNEIEISIQTQFCKNSQAINYLNAGFSEVHRFQYAGGDEKPIISQITVDKAFCSY